LKSVCTGMYWWNGSCY